MVKNQEYTVSTKKHLAIIAPLDWGLGHTTRCIPIIRQLQQNNFNVVIACNSNQKFILEAEFPSAIFVNLPGYSLTYGHSRWQTLLKLIFQLPNILISIKQENIQFKRILNQFTPNIIISDNRYGVFSSSIRSIFLTHQLKIITGAGSLADKMAAFSTHRMIRKFSECWIPDFEGGDNLAGLLSHPPRKPGFPLRYIGPLSRFEICTQAVEKEYILVILSGPEPQRSILETLLVQQLSLASGNIIIVRGIKTVKDVPVPAGNISFINFADSKELNKLICEARVVICRCGYTSVMDLFKLRKKAVLIPTPGQAEQEYLGRYLGSKELAVIADQEKLDILKAIDLTSSIKLPGVKNLESYKDTINGLKKELDSG